MTTKAEKRYLDRVAELPCVVCGAHGVHIHHARERLLYGEAVPDMQRRENASAGAKEARRYIEQGKAAIAARQDVGGVR